MTVAGDDAMRRAIARTLTEAVRATLPPDAPAKSFVAARDAAQVLGLAGLDRAIRACSEHAGRTRPADVGALVDRLSRLVDECQTTGDVSVFERLDSELVALAEELAAYEWDVSAKPAEDDTAAIPTLTVLQVLDDLTVTGEDSRRMAARLRLTATVAATLRASLDWLMFTSGARRVRVHGEPSLVEIRLDVVNPGGLGPAHRVLSAVGGNLGPAIDPDGPEGGWIIRVPSFATRPTYLMVMQGGIPLALPWHSVLRLRMMDASEKRDVRGPDYPMLETFAPPEGQAPQYPLILVAHGLKRAWLIADRLIWRMMADPCENPGTPPAGGLTEAVRTDEGERFWRAEPDRLLRRVDVPVPPARRANPPEPAAQAVTSAPAAAAASMPATAAPSGPASSEPAPGAAAPSPPTAIAASEPVMSEPAPEVSAPSLPVAIAASEPVTETAPGSAAPTPPTASEASAPAGAEASVPAGAEASVPAGAEASVSTTPERVLFPVPRPSTAAEASLPVAAPAPAPKPSLARDITIQVHPEEHPHALVAEDSLTGRIFLTRLLEQLGFTTDSVGSATELIARMSDHPWAVVLADVDLPDDRGTAWLRRVRDRAGETAAVVALVRDRSEVEMAQAAGIMESLAKPFDRTSLVALLVRLGFAKTGS